MARFGLDRRAFVDADRPNTANENEASGGNPRKRG
jgi:hypothetical protein